MNATCQLLQKKKMKIKVGPLTDCEWLCIQIKGQSILLLLISNQLAAVIRHDRFGFLWKALKNSCCKDTH